MDEKNNIYLKKGFMSKIFKLLVLIGFLIFTAWFNSIPTAQAIEDNGGEKNSKQQIVEGQIVVKLKENIKPESDKSLSAPDEESSSWQLLGGNKSKKLNIYLKKVKKGDEKNQIARFKKNKNVEWAELDRIVHVDMTPNDPYYSSSGSWGQSFDDLWGLKKIEAETTWDTSMGNGVKVAVVDTGVDYNHPDIAQNIWQNPGEVGLDSNSQEKKSNGIDDDNNGYIDDWRGWDASTTTSGGNQIMANKLPDNDPLDDQGHGTHVAGTIAATGNNNLGVIGVAPEAKIIPVKFLNDNGNGSSSDAASALIYAADIGAQVISNSWGGDYSKVVEEAVDYAHQSGAVIVAAAGNNALENYSSVSPSALPKAITVAATDYLDQSAGFSNSGKIDVAAPGVDILSLQSGALNGDPVIGTNYQVHSGTSMAAPHASAVAALILANNPTLTNEQVRQVLAKSADDLGAVGYDHTFGWGRINAKKAVQESSRGNALISSPLGRISAGTLEVKGEANAENFASYNLEYGASQNPSEWLNISSSSNPPASILGNWDASGLPAGLYSLHLRVLDSSNNSFENRLVVEISGPLVISDIAPTVLSSTEVVINWNTNRDAVSYIEYGLDGNYGNRIEDSISYLPHTDHVVQILGLQPNSIYHYRVVEEELAKIVTSQDLTFTTPASAFSIDNVLAAPSDLSATLSWRTSVPTKTSLQYAYLWGGDINYRYDNKIQYPEFQNDHSITLPNLHPDDLLYFVVRSTDEAGNSVTSGATEFRTLADTTPPTGSILINQGAQYTSDTQVQIWYQASDTFSNPLYSQYSADNVNFSDWVNLHVWDYLSLASGDGEKTVYVRYKDDAGNISSVYSDSILLDQTGPTGSIQINSDAAATSSQNVNLNLTATDVSAVAGMQFSNDGLNYTAWEIYSTNKNWSLSAGEGVKTVYVKYKDSLGHISAVYSDTIILDQTGPTGLILINNGAPSTKSYNVTLNIGANDSLSSVASMRFSNDSVIWSNWENYSATKNWTLSTGNGTKKVNVQFKDSAGNVSATYNDTIKKN